ncbi:MAG TPA: CbtA family protein [Actinoplanes sp.]|nr:CbtA family protein [Actinoplanes sp.]
MPLTGSTAPAFGAVLLRGLLAGLIAGLLAGVFGYAAGEPKIDAAIAIEEAAAHEQSPAAAPAGDDHHADELVGRAGQQAGLFLAMGLFGTAMGGLLATAYVFLRRRLHTTGDARAALNLAGAALLGVVIVPFVKYPANPPAVGNPDTIDQRTITYLAMVVIGLAAVWAATIAGRAVDGHRPQWLGWTASAAAFAAVVSVGYVALPSAEAVPDGFPADLLWDFRVVSLGTLVVLWSVLGVAFAALLTGFGTRPAAAPAEPAVPAAG